MQLGVAWESAGGGGASDGAQQQRPALPQPEAGQAGQHHLPADQAASAVQTEYAFLLPSTASLFFLLLPFDVAAASFFSLSLLLLPPAAA